MNTKTPATTNLPGDPSIEVNLRRSARARRYSLRVSQLDGRVTLTLPQRAPLGEGLAFLEERADWVRGHVLARPSVIVAGPGGSIPFEGEQLQVRVSQDRKSVCITNDELVVPEGADRAGARILAFMKHAARDRLLAACDRYADQLGRPYGRVTLRDTRSRWGSCSARGDLMFSWRLIMAPPPVLDYVAAHEVAHLVEMNHSRAFWNVVDGLCPDYATHRAWLREKGQELHHIRFGN